MVESAEHAKSIVKKRGHTLADAPCEATISRIVEMAWEDRTAFEAIESQFGLNESAVIALMRQQMKPSSFRMWRKRVSGRRTKHAVLRGALVLRHRATNTRQ
ncbi:MAG: TIGR03643 family protein [Verrucomicrobia bacterium]|nr:TIGR03643 family protein [Verrucomicrobiota bacterium]